MKFTRRFTANLKDAAVRWGASRNRSLFWRALPALLAGVGLLLVFFAANLQSTAKLKVEYRKAATVALGSGNFGTANVLYRKLIRLGSANQETLLEAAFAADKVGNRAEKEALLARLTKPGSDCVPAHLWVARELLTRPGGADLDRAEEHLERALELEPDNAETNLILGQMNLERQAWDEAAGHLEIAAASRPEAGLLLAAAFRESGEEERARAAAEATALELRRRLDAEAPDSIVVRRSRAVQLAETFIFLGRFADAETILREEQKQTRGPSEAELLRAPFARVYLAWHDALWREQPDDRAGESFALLSRAIRLSPENPEIVDRVAALAGFRELDRKLLPSLATELLSAGRDPFLVHLIQGAAAVRENRPGDAEFHLTVAGRIDPATASLLASLALRESDRGGAENPGASALPLELLRLAIQLEPENLDLRNSLAEMLARRGRWKEAAEELRQLLERQPDRSALHRLLAHCYEHLDRPEEAERHRKRERDLLRARQTPDF